MKQYLIYAWDGEDDQALDRRMAARPAHFDGARKLKETGNFLFGGALLDETGKMIGSTMGLQFATDEEFQQWMRQEPYVVREVWKKITVHPFKQAIV